MAKKKPTTRKPAPRPKAKPKRPTKKLTAAAQPQMMGSGFTVPAPAPPTLIVHRLSNGAGGASTPFGLGATYPLPCTLHGVHNVPPPSLGVLSLSGQALGATGAVPLTPGVLQNFNFSINLVPNAGGALNPGDYLIELNLMLNSSIVTSTTVAITLQ